MSDDLDEILKGWMARRGAADHFALEELAGHVAVLPPRRRRQIGPLASAAAVLLALGIAAIALIPRSSSGTAEPSAPVPPDPAAFAGDPRLAQCGATVATALDVFEMTHARDYHRYLPAMLFAPELDVDAPALVVVFRAMQSYPGGAPPAVGQTLPPARSLAPNVHDICILVGTDPQIAERNAYADVDTTGLTATIPTDAVSTPVEPSPATSAGIVASGDPGPTPTPGPAWAGDATAALTCSGAPSRFGRDHSPSADTGDAARAEDELRFYLRAIQFFSYPFPDAGFVEKDRIAGAVLDTLQQGRVTKAAIVISSRGTGTGVRWIVSSVAACDPSEFDPWTQTGHHPIGIWTDANGAAVNSSVLGGYQDCRGVTQIKYQKRLYVRMPNGGVDASQLETTWAANVTPPASAVATPYRSGVLRLFIAADRGAIYFMTSGRAERLPHVIGDAVTPSDCN